MAGEARTFDPDAGTVRGDTFKGAGPPRRLIGISAKQEVVP